MVDGGGGAGRGGGEEERFQKKPASSNVSSALSIGNGSFFAKILEMRCLPSSMVYNDDDACCAGS